ncbi:MAG: hypothetical protein Q8P79_02885 [Nanoarchaeota archaeon]|nr:hypothetical protein [Nanoarchaeota archaeon]
MGLIDRLKGSCRRLQENYRNGKEERRLLREKIHYDSIIDRLSFNTDIFDNRKVMIYDKLSAIPKPKGFLEELAYTFGGI